MATAIPVDELRKALAKLGLDVGGIAANYDGSWDVYQVEGESGEYGHTLVTIGRTDMALLDTRQLVAKIVQAKKDHEVAQTAPSPLEEFDRVRLTAKVWKGFAKNRVATENFRFGTVAGIKRVATGKTQYRVIHDNKATSNWPRESLELMAPEDDPVNQTTTTTVEIEKPHIEMPPPPEPEPKALTGADRFREGDAGWRERRKKSKRKKVIEAFKPDPTAGTAIETPLKEDRSKAGFSDPEFENFCEAVENLGLELHAITGREGTLKRIVVDMATYKWLRVNLTANEQYHDPKSGKRHIAIGNVVVLPDVS